MFISEIELIDELMQIYKDTRVKQELYLDSWLEGAYANLVPRILLRMRAMRRFVYCLQDAVRNDTYPNKIRLIGSAALEEMAGTHQELWDDYHPVFSYKNYQIILHLIEQVNIFSVDRCNLRDGIWEESDYWNFKFLDSLMGTICLICDEELSDYETYYEESTVESKADNEVECAWIDDDLYFDITPELDLPTWIKKPEVDILVSEDVM